MAFEQIARSRALIRYAGTMSRLNAIGVLLAAAVFEAGGDALMRAGLHSVGKGSRLGFFAIAAATLFAYGWLVNAPPWDLGGY